MRFPHLVRPRIVLGLAASLLGIVLGYGVYRERSEQPAVPAASAKLNAPASATPTVPRPPPPADPTARDLMQTVCKGGEESCACRAEAIKKAFSLALQATARELLDGAPANCIPELTSSGLRAEVLARVGDVQAARREAEALLLQKPNNAHAVLATALVLFAGGELEPSRSAARRAAELGRGAPAHMLLGLLSLREERLDEAERHLEQALAKDPNDVEATFNRAVLFERRRKYNPARETYLKVLALRPAHADSRYALARLTHAAGASDEARHHLRKLTEIAPQDSRIPALAAQLKGKAPSGPVLRAEGRHQSTR